MNFYIPNKINEIFILELEFHIGFLTTILKLLNAKGFQPNLIISSKNNLEIDKIINEEKILIKKKIIINTDNFIKNQFSKIPTNESDMLINFPVQSNLKCLYWRNYFVLKFQNIYQIILRPEEIKFVSTLHLNPIISLKKIILWIFRMRIVKKSNNVICSSPESKNFLLYSLNLSNIIVLPYSLVFGVIENTKKSPTKTIVICGSIDKGRRDYMSVLDAIEKIDPNLWKFVFLGFLDSNQINKKTYSHSQKKIIYYKSLLKRVSRLNAKGYLIKTFENRIPRDEYLRIIKNSDWVLVPAVAKNNFAGSWSAGMSEAIENGKPLIMKLGALLPEHIQQKSLTYDSINSLINILNSKQTRELETIKKFTKLLQDEMNIINWI